MNESQRRTLRIHNPDLTRDLDITADMTAKFLHYGIFNEDMIEEIKAEKTRKERVSKMLLLLTRRGPRAFDMFVHALQDTYYWLADDLKKTHHKIALKTEPDMLTLKERVDIYVHEQFGNKKRLCEEDKKDIRKFLYKHLKNPENDLIYVHDHRRNSLDSTVDAAQLDASAVNAKDIENSVLKKVYGMFKKDMNATDEEVKSENMDSNESECDFDDNEMEEITLEMIESKVKEMDKNVEDLQNEIKGCFSVLGLDNCEYALHDVLETYVENREHEKEEFANMKHKLDALERKRNKLEQTLNDKEEELKGTINRLANATHETERVKHLMQDLEIKCERLEKIHVKHMEKQQTLMTLKNMVNDLSPIRRQNQEKRHIPAYDDVDGSVVQTDYLQLPKIGQSQSHSHARRSRSRHSKQSRKSMGREKSSSNNHHQLPVSVCPPISMKGDDRPWKY
ncbi:hypothetical protein MAR_032345 [Mya arenaria]|uniref:CARD domain-containing protein n=1 Tax=Mya arenaria TaxID=6604 RepID=A0ABY7FAC6_MYAAR|nr:uncharacterized protein LOC128205662 [Mya arenaria]WAR17751.1 hypothetical protein MAR_032345 [Mya arenaria]